MLCGSAATTDSIFGGADDSRAMNLFLDYLTVIALFAFVALQAAIGVHSRERRINGRLRGTPETGGGGARGTV
ncbi:hypothetical protein SMICM304S_06420 [Streptomyces microflavus]